MSTDITNKLHSEGIYQFDSEELARFEKQLTKYFTREYKRYKDTTHEPIELGKGPLALVSEKLADDHYDEGLILFQNFLDTQTMSYSMAYYDEDPAKVLTSNKWLSKAQTDKFELIATRMQLGGNEKLLNFGCGFGYFESYLLNAYPELEISSITHSKDQHASIINRMNDPSDALSSNRFNLYYGQIDDNSSALLGKEKYDAVCSVGLMEHINNVEHFFKIINETLVDGGRMFHHLIVSRDLIPQLLDSNKTMIGDYFPGGKVLPFTALQQPFDNFILEDCWFVNGLNYWKTLNVWHENFWKNIQQIYPSEMNSERIRHWNNYFVLCKAMFFPEEGAAYGNGQYLYYKKNNQ